MPPVKEAFRLADQEAFTKLDVIEQMKEQAGAHAVYITDQKGMLHFILPKQYSERKSKSAKQNRHVRRVSGFRRNEAVREAPRLFWRKNHNEVVGTVTVEFLQDEIEKI